MCPILLDVSWLRIYTYGAAMVLGASVGGVWAWRSRPAGLFSLEQYLGLTISTVLSASFGARLADTAIHGTIGPTGLASALRVWERGGLASIGVPLAVLPVLIGYCVWQRLSFLRIMDHLFPFAILGAAIQRTFGCFAAGCCAGRSTDVPWAVRFPRTDAWVHPTQLYLGLALFLSFFLLRRVRSGWPGFTTFLGLAIYGAINLVVGIFRADIPALAIELGPRFHIDVVHGLMVMLALTGLWVRGLARQWNRRSC